MDVTQSSALGNAAAAGLGTALGKWAQRTCLNPWLCSALVGVLVACAPGKPPSVRAAELAGASDSDHSVALIGHLYSCFTPARAELPNQLIEWTTPLESLASELQDMDAEAVFFLGDNTRYSSEEEWQFLQQTLSAVDAPKHFVAGNHDHVNIEAFVRNGGKINESVVLHSNKYILLDGKMVLEPLDLEFLERELLDVDEYQNVFILMHYPLPSFRAPNKPVDPYGAYLGVSNWNRDVVPLIAGKVKYVFCGDLYLKGVHRVVQDVGEHQIHYVLNSFGFGRGRGGMKSTGDGPLVFLELRFTGESFKILPRTVPLDVKDPWYRSFHRLAPIPALDEGLWHATQVESTPLAIALTSDWNVGPVQAAQLFLARKSLANSDQVIRLQLSEGPAAWNEDFELFDREWIQPLRDRDPTLKLESKSPMRLPGHAAWWLVLSGRRDGQAVVRFVVSCRVQGRQFVLSYLAPRNLQIPEEENFRQILDRLQFND